jgi:GT2 family glycosyltransferase
MTDPLSAITVDELTVVIVTYNSAHCVPALAAGLQGITRVIVVDNASDDDTVACIQAQIPQAWVLANASNLGFGAANNRALREVQTRYSLLLNPDCLPGEGFFMGMVRAANQFPDAAILAPHLLRRNGEVELSYRWPATHWTSAGPGALGSCSVGFVCGAVMLLNMPVMQTIGFFDETFFLYYEDDDLCLRLFNAQLPVVLVPEVQAVHSSRGSVKGKVPLKSEYIRGYYHAQSKLTFEKKHGTLRMALQQRRQLLATTSLALFFRVLLVSPKRLARMWGRWRGLMAWATQHGH